MVLVPLSEAKTYLRVDSSDEDALIGVLLSTAKHLCADVARLDSDKWSVVSGETEDEDMYTDEELERIREVMRVLSCMPPATCSSIGRKRITTTL